MSSVPVQLPYNNHPGTKLADNLDWEERADLLYHFYAYQEFAHPNTGAAIDLVGLTDADVQYFNRVSYLTEGMSSQYKLANYLNDYGKTITSADTHRKRLIHHVLLYNHKQPSRRRFYMLNVSVDDFHFMAKFHKNDTDLAEPAISDSDESSEMNCPIIPFQFATDGVRDSTDAEVGTSLEEEAGTLESILECWEERCKALGKFDDTKSAMMKYEADIARLQAQLHEQEAKIAMMEAELGDSEKTVIDAEEIDDVVSDLEFGADKKLRDRLEEVGAVDSLLVGRAA